MSIPEKSDNSSEQKGPVLIGTNETIQSLSPYIQENLAKWSGAKIGVLFISGEDIRDVDFESFAKDEGGYDNAAYYMECVNAMKDFLDDNPDFHNMINYDDYINIETLSTDYDMAYFEHYQSIKDRFFAVNEVNKDSNTGQPDYVIIQSSLRPDKITKELWLSQTSGMPEELLHSAAGNAEDYLLFAIGHEIFGHVHDNDRPKGGDRPEDYLPVLTDEIKADMAAVKFYKNEYQKGHASTDRLPEDKLDMRAISALRVSPHVINHMHYNHPYFNSHATSGGINIDGKNFIRNEFNAEAIGSASIHVNTMAAIMLGNYERHISESEGLDPNEVRRLNIYKNDPVVNTLYVGSNMIVRNPLAHYASVKTLLEKGYFPEGEPEYKIAKDFVKAFEEHVHGVDSNETQKYLEDMKSIKPPTQDLLDRVSSIKDRDVTDLSADTTINPDTKSVLETTADLTNFKN